MRDFAASSYKAILSALMAGRDDGISSPPNPAGELQRRPLTVRFHPMKRLFLIACLVVFGCTARRDPVASFKDVVNQYESLTNSCFIGAADRVSISVVKTNLVDIPYMAVVRYSEGFRTTTKETVSISLRATFSFRGEKWAEKTLEIVDRSRVGTNDFSSLDSVLDCEERQWQAAVMYSNLPHIR